MKNLKMFPYIFFCISTLITACEEDNLHSSVPQVLDKELLVSLINNYRVSGCNCGAEYYEPVTQIVWNDTIELAAKVHSNDMNNNNFFNHTGSDGSSAGDRLNRVGYSWTTWGENIAKGYTSEIEVVEGWISSVGHCKNIMNANFKEMGVATSGSYWTQLFAKQ